MATLTNVLTQVTQAQLENLAISALETELGIQLISFLETPLPVWPFIALAYAVVDIFSLFSGGKPVTVDTNNVIRAYNMSAYTPLHSLAADLSEMLKNGAPISDSRPEIQAQFRQLKQGTVETLQSLVGAQPGPSGDGYWQFFNLIELTWQYAGNYNTVLDLVKAIDQFTIGLSQYEQQDNTNPTPAPAPTPGTGPQQPGTTTPPCPPFLDFPACLPQLPAVDQSLDEVGNAQAALGYWLNVIAIYTMNLYQAITSITGAPAANADPVTCAQLTTLVAQIVAALGSINITVPAPTAPGEPAASVDLTAVVEALTQLNTTLEAIVTAIENLTTAAAPIAPDLQAKWEALVQSDVNAGLINATDAQILLS